MPDDGAEEATIDPRAQGQALRRRLLGDARTDAPRKTDQVSPAFGEISDELVYGNIWLRDGLPLETRSLVTIAALLGRGLFDYVRVQMYGAKRLGVTQDELAEVCIQLIPYAGMPVAQNGLRIVAEVFAEDAPEEAPNW